MSVAAPASLPPSAYAAELRRDLRNRIENLAAQLDDLLARRLDGVGMAQEEGAGGRNPNGGTSPSAGHELLEELCGYPKLMRTVADSSWDRSTRDRNRTMNLRRLIARVIHARRLIEEWFAAPGSMEVPDTLTAAVESMFEELGITERQPVVTAGPPDKVDIIVTDARKQVFTDVQTELGPDTGRPFAVLRVPNQEASSPRWWPVVVGHETAHQKLSIEEEEWKANAEPVPDDGAPELPLGSPDPGMPATFFLQDLDLLKDLPITELRTEIAKEHAALQRLGLAVPFAGRPRENQTEPTSAQTGPVGDSTSVVPLSDTQMSTAVAKRVEILDSWAREVFCDLVMLRRFGPAAVAAMSSFLVATESLGKYSESHPPGFFRIELMIRHLGEVPAIFQPILDAWKLSDSDTGQHAALHPWARLLCDYLESSLDAIAGRVGKWTVSTYNIHDPQRQSAVVLASRQLAVGLPPYDASPDAFPKNPWATPSDADPRDAIRGPVVELTDADIVNAGWLAVINQSLDGSAIHAKVPIDRLMLKSLESKRLTDAIRADDPTDGEPEPQTASPINSAGILGPAEILHRISEPSLWDRIVVTPNITPEVKGPSIDLRLGSRFIIFQRTGIASFNAVSGNNPRAVQRLVERPFESPFVLHPGEVVLASALEYIALPQGVAAQVITRSSYGRLGLITATAVQVHPLYRGCLTLELVNLGTVPMALYPGERVAQLVFFSVSRRADEGIPTQDQTFSGTYVCPTGPEFPTVAADPWMRKRIRARSKS